MTWSHPPVREEPHPQEIDQMKGIREMRLAVPLTEQVRVHHLAKKDAPLIIAKEDVKERERNRHFKIETCTITTTDHTIEKRTQEEREVKRESMERGHPLLGQPDQWPQRDWPLWRMRREGERSMSIKERDIPLQGENNHTTKTANHLSLEQRKFVLKF